MLLKFGGFKINHVHYIIRFKQADYIKEFIALNHKLRCETTDKNDEKIIKLINSSLCGRALLSKENFNIYFQIISDFVKAEKAVSKDTFKDYDMLNEESALFNIEKQYIKLDSPCYIRSCILDSSEILIYNYYCTLKNKYKDDSSMLYIDTDGFLCNIRNHDDVIKKCMKMKCLTCRVMISHLNTTDQVIIKWVK